MRGFIYSGFSGHLYAIYSANDLILLPCYFAVVMLFCCPFLSDVRGVQMSFDLFYIYYAFALACSMFMFRLFVNLHDHLDHCGHR